MGDSELAGATVVVRLRHLMRYLSQFPDDAVVVADGDDASRLGSGAYVNLAVALAHVRQEVVKGRNDR